MNKIAIPISILLGAALGVGGYFAAGKFSAPKTDENAKRELAQLRRNMADLQRRLGAVEQRPGFQEVLANPDMREQLAAVVVETRTPGVHRPRPPVPGSQVWRGDMARRCRDEYGRILEAARKAMALDAEQWAKAKLVFVSHFAPVEAELKKLEDGKLDRPPAANGLVSGGLDETLRQLKAKVGEKSYAAFDAWRKNAGTGGGWGTSKGDYFLAGDEYESFKNRRNLELNWQVLVRGLSKYYARAKVKEAARGKADAVFRKHLEAVCKVLQGEKKPNLQLPSVRSKVKVLTVKTEAELLRVVGMAGVNTFRKWKSEEGNRVSIYFGEVLKLPVNRHPKRPPAVTPKERKPAARF